MKPSQHLFQVCYMASLAWQSDPYFINFIQHDPISFQEWIIKQILLCYSEDGQDSVRITKFITKLWSLWFYRNEGIFENVGPDISRVMSLVAQMQ